MVVRSFVVSCILLLHAKGHVYVCLMAHLIHLKLLNVYWTHCDGRACERSWFSQSIPVPCCHILGSNWWCLIFRFDWKQVESKFMHLTTNGYSSQAFNIDLHLFSCFWTSNWMTSGRISTFLVLKVPHIRSPHSLDCFLRISIAFHLYCHLHIANLDKKSQNSFPFISYMCMYESN